ncbi:efflux RND transporter periplasmic adaptor subunit [Aureibacter tunicatorum]|uniref:RND family efflux transporter MFP subunit n=1 Tax=Aureibacter tunicatorum TaxID=866807 RepID=A0AAE3XLP5_9BACT|nr:efflux RND transporter periplasmic adaptor subunit [Aureibacter tunicatorum]MDR6238274.1 RND family efflux transporter MFP subunit [Aureibacter tunicatorum]BDD03307.1 hypothetical protein AUTU_07900 [Aureibacter tunicatorum]
MRYLIILFTSIALFSCKDNSAQQDGHAHNADGSHPTGGVPSEVFTINTNNTELFVEFPALVKGKTSRFAAHVTSIKGHKPANSGSVTAMLIIGNEGIKHTVDAPSSKGIFSPKLQPTKDGKAQLIFEINTPDIKDKITINDITIYPTIEAAQNGVQTMAEPADAIPFLKEQAWRVDFQTEKIAEGEIFDVISGAGQWKENPTETQLILANANGSVRYISNDIVEGKPVKKGDLIMLITGNGLSLNNIQTEINKAKSDYDKAKSNYNRKKSLADSKIIPQAEIEAAKNEYEIAKSNYQALSANASQKGKKIKAPFDGFISDIKVGQGDYVNEGDILFAVDQHLSHMLEIPVSPSYANQLRQIHNIHYKTGNDTWSNLLQSEGTIISTGKKISSENPMLPVSAIVNEHIDMPLGSYTETAISIGEPQNVPLVPASALLEDYGKFSVILQISGEVYTQRNVKLGRRNGAYAEVLEGLKAGDVVVTEGAFQVKMASMSGQTPAHGHAH